MGVPDFGRFSPASAASSRAKRANRHVDTIPEILRRRELWRLGLRFRKNVATIAGKPDVCFRRAQIVIFCDGDFWHGRNWDKLYSALGRRANAAYWLAKIQSNRERDTRITHTLRQAGWYVIRVWEGDIKRDPTGVARRIKRFVEQRLHAAVLSVRRLP